MNLILCMVAGGLAMLGLLYTKEFVVEVLHRLNRRKESKARREEFIDRTLSQMSRFLSEAPQLRQGQIDRIESQVGLTINELNQTNQNLVTLTEKLVEVLQKK